MATPPTIRDQTYSYFLTEAQDLLQGMEQDLLSLKSERSPAKVHSLMRAAHTLKGAAASVGFESMKTMAHTLEDVFKAFYKPEVEIDAELEALLFEGYECLRSPLTSVLAGLESNDDEVLERAATIFAQLQQKLGDYFDPGATIPSSAELGFDITQSIFETGVRERLEQLATVVSEPDTALLAQVLQTQAEVFVGLAESLNLKGFGAIAQTTLTALNVNPDQVRAIAQAALADFQQGQSAVLGGDRTRGGEPSETLKQFIKRPKPSQTRESSHPRSPEAKSRLLGDDLTKSWNQLIAFLNRPLWKKSASAPRVVPQANPPVISKTAPKQLGMTEMQETLEETFSLDLLELANQFESAEINPSESQGANSSEDSNAGFELWDEPLEKSPEWVNSEGDSPAIFDNPPQQTLTREPSPQPQATIAHSATIRVDLEHLDSLNYSTSELLINQNRQALQDDRLQVMIQDLLNGLRQHQQTMTELRDWSDQMLIAPEKGQAGEFSGLMAKSAELKAKFDSLELDHHSELQVLSNFALEELGRLETDAEAIELLARETSQSLKKQGRLITNVRDDLMAVRMVPIGTVLNRFPRVLQQLIETHGKTIHLELKGTHVLVDKAVAEKLYDPLLHLIRNAFDHGIESSENRIQAGKSAIGKIAIHAYQQGNRTLIDVSDDGRGLDLKKICQRGYELQRVSSDQVEHSSKVDLLNLLFEPGFSTADQLSDLSGRGVGLDVVKSQLHSLNGSVNVRSEFNQGTTFSLQLPLTRMSARLLVCQAGGTVYALLSDEVEKILAPQDGQAETVAGKRVLHWNQNGTEQPIPLYTLSHLVHYTTACPLTLKDTLQNKFSSVLTADAAPILLIRRQAGLIGVEVDRILGEQELVIQPMGTAIAPPAYVYGCSILGDGQLMLVIDAVMLVQQGSNTVPLIDGQDDINVASNDAPNPSKPVQPIQAVAPVRKTVLVIDDSVTVRQMLTLTLQSAGYRVLQAQDGLEAIAQLQQHSEIHLITCDVEMPRLNGFEFLMRYRQEPTLVQVPVVMLTSRSNEKHQRLAMQLGATAYLTKPYGEQMLLEKAADLISKQEVKVRAF